MNWQFPVAKWSKSRFRLSSPRTGSWRLLPGSAAALTAILLWLLGAWKPLEYSSYNFLFQLRGALLWDARVVVVGIDDSTLRQLGQYPLARSHYADLIDRLNQAGASVVVLNVVFTNPSPDDPELARAIATHGNVVLATAWDNQGQALAPVVELQQGAIAIGQIYNQPDKDGVTRQVPIAQADIPTLSVAALEAYNLVQEAIPLPSGDRPLWINWLGAANSAPQYSMIEVLQGRVPPEALRHKMVVVGNTAPGLDNILTPFNQTQPATGAYLHATLISNLLQQQTLRPIDAQWQWLILWMGGPVLGWGLSYYRWRSRLLLASSVALGWALLVILGFSETVLLPAALPLGLIGITAGLVELMERFRLDAALNREIKRLWQAYLPKQANLERNPTERPWQLSAEPQNAFIGSLSSETLTSLTQLAEQFAQVHAAQQATELSHQLTTVTQNLSLGLLAADLSGLVWFFNPVIVEWLPVQVGDRLQAHLVPDWLSEADWQKALQALQTGQSVHHEVERGDRWFSCKLEPLLQFPGATEIPRPGGLLLTLEEITIRKQAEGQIHQDLEHERQLGQVKSQFINILSHEFRTPLTIIQSTTDLLEYFDWSEDERQQRFQQIRKAVTHMTQLLEDVLLIGRADARAIQCTLEPTDLVGFCRDILTTFQLTSGQHHQLKLVQKGSVHLVALDSRLIRQVLSNLLSNAIKYSAPGSTITLELIYQTDQVMLHVKDQGIGIPLEDQPHLFEVFHRAANATDIQGTGLGLVVVKKCVELMQGQISVTSEVDLGTTFTLTFPLPT